MSKTPWGSTDGGAKLFVFVLILFLAVVAGGGWFFTQHPEGKRIASDLLKQYVHKSDGAAPDNGAAPTAQPDSGTAPGPDVSAPDSEPEVDLEELRKQAQADVYFREASSAFDKGELDRAAEYVDYAIGLVPNHSGALKLLIEVERKKSERRVEEERRKRLEAEAAAAAARAAGETEPATEPQPDAPVVADILARARAFLEAGDLEKAEEYARSAVDADPADTEAIQVLRSVLIARKPVPAAPRAEDDSAVRTRQLVDVARECLANEDFTSARSFANKALELTPGDDSARSLLAEINREARAAATRGNTQDVLLAEINRLRQEVSSARAEINKSSTVPVAQQDTTAMDELRLELDRKLRMLDEAEKRRDSENSQRAASLAKQARMLLDQGSYDAAREVAVRALALVPEDPELPILINRIEKARRDALQKEAASSPAPVIQPAPVSQPEPVSTVKPPEQDPAEKARALLASARLLAQAGSVQAARSTGLRALEIDPSNVDIISFLASLEEKPQVLPAPRPEPASTPEPATGITVIDGPDPEPHPGITVIDSPDPHADAGVAAVGVSEPEPGTGIMVADAPDHGPEPGITVIPGTDSAPSVDASLISMAEARLLLADLDTALQNGNTDAYFALLGEDAALSERDNLDAFMQEASGIRVTRPRAVSVTRSGDGAMVSSDYVIEYTISGSPLRVELAGQYRVARAPDGKWIIVGASAAKR
ncbi:MAG: tetratricopeptide repeat protein [Planctomycetes bacterium]|nr:tetratricopeptide repeat protein [Planctomycetota bacterium]